MDGSGNYSALEFCQVWFSSITLDYWRCHSSVRLWFDLIIWTTSLNVQSIWIWMWLLLARLHNYKNSRFQWFRSSRVGKIHQTLWLLTQLFIFQSTCVYRSYLNSFTDCKSLRQQDTGDNYLLCDFYDGWKLVCSRKPCTDFHNQTSERVSQEKGGWWRESW